MTLLKDDELLAAIRSGSIRLSPFDVGADPFRADSPIQPSSLDLTVGGVLVPPPSIQPKVRAAPLVTRTGHHLLQGETAVVITRESIRLAPDLAAFGFPPSSVSSQGILMTNPGHVDPGYEGTLTFTLINMGRQPYDIRLGTPIVTLLIYRLSAPVTRDYDLRHGGVAHPRCLEQLLQSLSPDFINVKERAREVAKSEINRVQLQVSIRQFWVPLIVALVAAGGSLFAGIWGKASTDDLHKLAERVSHIEASNDVASLRADITLLKTTVEQLGKGMTAPTQIPGTAESPSARPGTGAHAPRP